MKGFWTVAALLLLPMIAADRRFLRDVSLQVEVIGSSGWARMWGWAAPNHTGELRVLSVFISLDDNHDNYSIANWNQTTIPCDPLPPCAPTRSPCNISILSGEEGQRAYELWAPLAHWTHSQSARVMMYVTLTDGLEVGRVVARAWASPAAYHCQIGSAFLPSSPIPVVAVVRSMVPIDSLIFNHHPFTPDDASQCRWTTGTAEDSAWLEQNLLGVPNISLTTLANDVWFIPHEPGVLVATFDSEKKNS